MTEMAQRGAGLKRPPCFSLLATFMSAALGSYLVPFFVLVLAGPPTGLQGGVWNWLMNALGATLLAFFGAVILFIPTFIGATVPVFVVAWLFDRYAWTLSRANAAALGAGAGLLAVSIVIAVEGSGGPLLPTAISGLAAGGLSGLLYLHVLRYLGRVG